MKAFKFSFLLLSNEYFHVGQHDLLLLKNQASSMMTGIYKDKELNKRKLALELLRDWIRQFNPASYNDLINGLSEDFKKRTVMLVDQIPEKQKSRYHINEDALITLPSGEIVAISNQWGIANIELLIEFVRQNGFVVEKAEQ